MVRIRAFGMNHSEKILRLEEIEESYIQKPMIPGIECAGEIVDPSDSRFSEGDVVIAMMGGMGRSFDDSYAEYAVLPEHHVFKVEPGLAWEELAAIPETYLTAWGSLFECLDLQKGDTLLIRGASGVTAMRATANIAKSAILNLFMSSFLRSIPYVRFEAELTSRRGPRSRRLLHPSFCTMIRMSRIIAEH